MLTFRQFSEAAFSVGIDYSLEAKYQHFNLLLFGGELPTIPISWSSALKKASGRILFKPMNFGFSVVPGSVRMEISSLFRSSEERLDGIMVHEMIHVYFTAIKNDGRESHGSGFRAKLAHYRQRHGRFARRCLQQSVARTAETKDFGQLRLPREVDGVQNL